jgi:hypothetical protein
MSVKKLRAAQSADAFYQREEARATLALWQAQDTSQDDYREKRLFEKELSEAADRVRAAPLRDILIELDGQGRNQR